MVWMLLAVVAGCGGSGPEGPASGPSGARPAEAPAPPSKPADQGAGAEGADAGAKGAEEAGEAGGAEGAADAVADAGAGAEPQDGAGPEGGADAGAAQGGEDAGGPEGPESNCSYAQGDAAPGMPEGPRTTVKGLLQVASGLEGPLLIEVMDEAKGAELVHASLQCNEAGPFQVDLPRAFGKVRLVAFVDVDNNGPTATDPAGMSEPLALGADPVPGVRIQVKKGASLGAFTPVVPTPPAAAD